MCPVFYSQDYQIYFPSTLSSDKDQKILQGQSSRIRDWILVLGIIKI